MLVNEVYGGGGNSGATYTNDFVELTNRSDAAVSLDGWSVQYHSGDTTGTWQVTPLSGSIAPGAFYLVGEAQGAGGTLTDLISTLPRDERYTYVYDGISEVLDHILVSARVRGVRYQVVHVNAEYTDQASDHDPQVLRMTL